MNWHCQFMSTRRIRKPYTRSDSVKDKATYLKEWASRYQEKHLSMDNYPTSWQWLERGGGSWKTRPKVYWWQHRIRCCDEKGKEFDLEARQGVSHSASECTTLAQKQYKSWPHDWVGWLWRRRRRRRRRRPYWLRQGKLPKCRMCNPSINTINTLCTRVRSM